MHDQERFDPTAVAVFRVVDRAYDPATRTVTLGYAFDEGTTFTETITFETPPPDAAPDPGGPGFERALLHLHLAAGTSYYKAAAPPVVAIEGVGLSEAEADLHHHLYDDGLREFAVANGLPVPLPVELRPELGASAPPPPDPTPRPGGLAVPIGGGKDSMVLVEAVRHLEPVLFAVNPHPLVVELAHQAGLPLLVVRRRLSPNLAELNRRGARNGHVPVTAIVSLIAAVGSFVYGYDTIAMAVERSASEETAVVDGVPVNHQYSKSLPFERLLAGLLSSTVDPGLVYGSALRPYSELAIARSFARLDRYHATFCSCNAAFRHAAGPDDRWCGNCPKCRFVALMLAPWLGRDQLAAILGRDLFDDPGQVLGFGQLMSEGKPFECVGERRESAVALRLLTELPGWASTAVVAELAGWARSMVTESDVAATLAPDPSLRFPDPAIAGAVADLLGRE